MKGNAIARIVIYSVLALLLISILCVVLLIGGFTWDFGSDGGTVVDHEGSISAADVTNLEIEWASGAVTIRRGDTDQITFTETVPEDSKYQMVYTCEGDTLSIRYGKGTVGFGFGNFSIPSKDLTITVPQDWTCEKLEIDGASLTISIQNLTVDTLELDGASCNLGFIGNIRRLDVDGASTDLHLECLSRPILIDIDGASCELDLILPKGCGFAVNMDGLSCDLRSDLPYTSKNNQHVYGDGHCNINIDGASCDVTISESAECAHVWDEGKETTVPGGGHLEMVFTCTICGETKSEYLSHSHSWDSGTSLGSNSIVYRCTQCGEIRTLTATEPQPERHGFIWQDWDTRELLEDQIFEPGYYEGAEIVFTTEIFSDYILELYCDGVFVCGPTVVGDHWEFYYTMPDHIVYIELRKAAA